ncbi:uncharacterized protein LOC121986722 [Zingiber officinale]|uniref:uncharacterized protein LOC121986722 n=1 Tax=Zingiber officinale TaxID=94328 RepID=UPI001C4B88A8|nr:uncharacterized protein LOC121986722 [Zingiber officinale]
MSCLLVPVLDIVEEGDEVLVGDADCTADERLRGIEEVVLVEVEVVATRIFVDESFDGRYRSTMSLRFGSENLKSFSKMTAISFSMPSRVYNSFPILSPELPFRPILSFPDSSPSRSRVIAGRRASTPIVGDGLLQGLQPILLGRWHCDSFSSPSPPSRCVEWFLLFLSRLRTTRRRRLPQRSRLRRVTRGKASLDLDGSDHLRRCDLLFGCAGTRGKGSATRALRGSYSVSFTGVRSPLNLLLDRFTGVHSGSSLAEEDRTTLLGGDKLSIGSKYGGGPYCRSPPSPILEVWRPRVKMEGLLRCVCALVAWTGNHGCELLYCY